MKKLLISMAALLATAGLAMGAGFELPAVTEASAGTQVVIPVSAVGTADVIQGVNLNMEVNAALSFVGADMSTGVFGSNNTGFNITPMGQYLIATTTTASATVPVPGLIALLTVDIPAGTPDGDYFIRTYVLDFGVESDFTVKPAEFQGNGIIRVPEPATALLLLGVLPFLRRRGA